ncbi:MAG: ferrochelatase [Myxococcota bacterium]|nr:ferrochelatase [Myxococcota bacterium]
MDSRTGILLLQLGTPDSPQTGDVRRYLRQFLSDPRVLDIGAVGRFLLLNLIILPFRPRKSAEAYESIWTEAGSPLLTNGLALAEGVAKRLGDGTPVELGMRYGQPSIESALDRLIEAGVERVIALPLFPQEAGSSTGSALQELHRAAGARWNVPTLTTLPPFFEHPGFVRAVVDQARVALEDFEADHVLFSYHGLPERQIRRAEQRPGHCLASEGCCDTGSPALAHCYRAQCYATTRAVAAALELAPDAHSTAFQSRLGRDPWIQPFTDHLLDELPKRGVRRLAVLCPSFVADCLETLEEIGIRGREQWLAAGGEELRLVPCVNASDGWIEAVADMVREAR